MVLAVLLTTLTIGYQPSKAASVTFRVENREYRESLAFWSNRKSIVRTRQTPFGKAEARVLKPVYRETSSPDVANEEHTLELRGPAKVPFKVHIQSDWPNSRLKVDGRDVEMTSGSLYQKQGMHRQSHRITMSLPGGQHEITLIQPPGE